MKTNFQVEHQNPLYIDAHKAMLNATACDRGYADLMMKADLLTFKTSFARFCVTNHWYIVRDSNYIATTNASMFDPELEEGYDPPLNYGDATMRHSN